MLLTIGRLGDMGQAEILFLQGDEVRGEDDATGVAGPVLHIETGVVFRQEGISRVPEDRLDEVEIAHEIARSEKARLHRLFLRESRHFRTDEGAEEERGERLHRLGLGTGVGQGQELVRRIQGRLEEPGEGDLRHRELVRRDR